MERRDPNVHEALRCPQCRQWMQPGFVAVSQGLLWLRNPESATVDFAENLPGTNAIMRANRLPGWRCLSCELVLLRYGRTVHKHLPIPKREEVADPATDPWAQPEDDDEAMRSRVNRR